MRKQNIKIQVSSFLSLFSLYLFYLSVHATRLEISSSSEVNSTVFERKYFMQCNLNILSHMYTHTSLLFVLPDNKQGCYCIAQCLIPVLSTCVHTLFPSPASASNSACSFYYLFPPFTEVERPEWTMTLSFYCHHESWNSSIYIFVCSYNLIMVTQHQCYCYNGRS